MGPTCPAGTMINVYPDSIGGTLADLVDFVHRPEVAGVFSQRPTCSRASSTPTSTAASP